MADKLLSLLGLAKRAGKLEPGFDAAVAAVRSGKASLLVAARDISKKTVYRELPFMLKTAYNNLFDDRKVDENIFLQGVIDLLILDGDKAVIVDYKYSRNSDYLKNKYGKQLNSYAQAVREILRVENVEKYILSIADGKLIKM